MKKILLTILTFGLFATSCTKNFEEINENPNAPETVRPQFLLSNIISVAADKNTYDEGFRLANFLEQFAASQEFERIDRYEMGTNSDYWNTLYHLLADVKSMKDNENSNEAYQAVGDIMSSFMYSQLTDMWGDVPYSESIQAKEGILEPDVRHATRNLHKSQYRYNRCIEKCSANIGSNYGSHRRRHDVWRRSGQMDSLCKFTSSALLDANKQTSGCFRRFANFGSW